MEEEGAVHLIQPDGSTYSVGTTVGMARASILEAKLTNDAVAAERERCAKIADKRHERHGGPLAAGDNESPEETARRRGYQQGFLTACESIAQRIRSGE